MANGFPGYGITKRQKCLVNKAMRTPNPTMRNAMLRSAKKR